MAASFVGRAWEMASLGELCRGAFSDQVPAAALIVGEPGSGKSRLLSEVAKLPEIDERIVITGFELERSIALAAARALVRRLSEVPGAMVDVLAFGGPMPAEPIRLFEAAHRALAALGPVLIVVDDLQWVDDASIALLHYLLRAAATSGQPVATVIAARPSVVAATLLGSLISVLGPGRFQSIDLGPLDREAGLRLVHAVAPRVDETHAVALWEAAAGSPFWLELLATSDDRATDLARVVSDRLRVLSADEVDVLAVLVVAARPLSVDAIGRILESPSSRVAATVPILEMRGLLRQEAGTCAVTHDLMRDVVASTLTVEHTRWLHDRIGAWLEAAAVGDDLLLLQALEHRCRSGQPVVLMAARLASSDRRRVLGAAGFERLAVIADETAIDEPGYAELHEALAAMASELGLHEEALRRWSDRAIAVEDAIESGRAELRASEAALVLGRRRDARHHWEQASRTAPDDPVLAVEVLAQRAALRQFLDHRPDESRQAADDAVAAARAFLPGGRASDQLDVRVRRAVLRALFAGLQGAQFAGDPEQMLRFADELAAAAAGFDVPMRIRAVVEGALALRFQGRNDEAERRLRQAWIEARRRVLPEATLEVGAALAGVVLSMGHVEEADAITRECLALDTRLAGFRSARSFSVVLPHLVELTGGDWRRGVEGLRSAALVEREPHYRQHAHRERAIALARLDPARSAGEVREAVSATLADAEAAACRRCLAEAICRCAEALARVGQVESARSLLDEARILAADAFNGLWRQRAAVAIVASADPARAVVGLEDLIVAAEQQCLQLEAVWIRLDLGALLGAVDRPRATSVLRRAGAVAEAAGALTESRLADQQLRGLGVRTWRRAGSRAADDRLAGLTNREREIARLVAEGASNPEIATAVFVSRKTVERHLSNIFAKAGVRNRAELAALSAGTAHR